MNFKLNHINMKAHPPKMRARATVPLYTEAVPSRLTMSGRGAAQLADISPPLCLITNTTQAMTRAVRVPTWATNITCQFGAATVTPVHHWHKSH